MAYPLPINDELMGSIEDVRRDIISMAKNLDFDKMKQELQITRRPTSIVKIIPAPQLHSISTSDNAVTGFFDLPREIRDEIYHCLWTTIPSLLLPYSTTPYLEPGCDIAPAAVEIVKSKVTRWQLRLKARYNVQPTSSETFSGPPSGISANKALLQEALDAFHLKGVVQFENYYHTSYTRLQYIYTSMSFHRVPDEQRLKLLLDLTNIPSHRYICGAQHNPDTTCALTPFPIQALRMDIGLEGKGFSDANNKRCSEISILENDELALWSMVIRYMRLGAPKTLKIYLSFAEKPRQAPSRTSVDLSLLDCLSHIAQSLEILEIVVDSGEMDRDHFIGLAKVMATEMIRFGKSALLGMTGSIQTIEKDSAKLQSQAIFTKV